MATVKQNFKGDPIIGSRGGWTDKPIQPDTNWQEREAKRRSRKRHQIPGLIAVQPMQQSTQMPLALSLDEVREIDEHAAKLLNPTDYKEAIFSLQEKCQFAHNVGRNPELIGVEDFRFAVYEGAIDPRFPPTVPAGAYFCFIHPQHGAYLTADAEPHPSHNRDSHYLSMAFSLIARAPSNPDETEWKDDKRGQPDNPHSVTNPHNPDNPGVPHR